MAADEYYDAIGQVLSYVLSAEDFVVGQRSNDTAKHFVIDRDGTHLEFFANPDDRYFMIVSQFSLVNKIIESYEQENQLLRGHIEKYDINDSDIGDKNLNEKVAFERVRDVTEEEANRITTDIGSLGIHSGCRIENSIRPSPWPDSDEEIWDGVLIAGLLYPYEDDFSPRDYEEVAQEVISVGNQIDTTMAKLDIMEEIGFESTG